MRVRYLRQRFALELAASRKAVLDTDLLGPDEVETANNYILYAGYELIPESAGRLWDRARRRRARSAHLPRLQSTGTFGERLSYWLDAAHVRGREDGE